jgi:DNA repair exonuclease SbcCD nuclease subunit
MKMLWVGDVHATVRELEDVQALLDYIEKVAREHKPDLIFFAGDLYDNFSLVNTAVMEFWKAAFKRLTAIARVVALKGNHDMSNDSASTSHALMAHDTEIRVIDSPVQDIKNGILYMPFVRNPEEFTKCVQAHDLEASKLVFCHQDFSGAKYENGFYSKEGVDPRLIADRVVVSGHIHMPYEFGNVWYPGAPRWRTLSDASVQDRFIYLFDIQDGEIKSKTPFSTNEVCRRIVSLDLTPETCNVLESLNYSDKADYRVSITGPEDFVRATEIAVYAKIPNAKVAAVVIDEAVKLRESEGITASFQKWFDAFNPPFGTNKDVLRQMVTERIHV